MALLRWPAIAALILCASGLPGAWADRLTDPMSFTMHTPCEGSACEPYLLAEGTIVIDTPSRFGDALQALQVSRQHPRIYFNSPGGNLQAGLDLGRLIREAGFDTYVGGPYQEFVRMGEAPRTLAQRGVCFSACAYGFLGGVSRSIGPQGKYGLHQFSGAAGEIGDARTQLMMATLAKYLDEMGVDRRFLDFAATTTPEKIKVLPLALARELNVDNQEPPKVGWRIEANADGALVATLSQGVAGRDASFAMQVLREDRRLVGKIRYRVRQTRLPAEDLVEEFTVRGGPDLVFRSLGTPGGPRASAGEQVVVGDGWHSTEDGGFATSFPMDSDLVTLLTGSSEVEFSALPASRVAEVAPRVRLSTQGLANALRALER
jgi:hypothetical protein